MTDPAPARWNAGVVVLHGIGAIAMIAMLALGLYMTKAELESAPKFDLYQWHKTLGWLTLVLIAARLARRAVTKSPAPLPTISPRVRALATSAHFALYALALAVGITGWIRISADVIPIPIDLFGLASVPNIAPVDNALSETMASAHAYATYALIALVALHIAASLKHHFVDRDATLRRMFRGI